MAVTPDCWSLREERSITRSDAGVEVVFSNNGETEHHYLHIITVIQTQLAEKNHLKTYSGLTQLYRCNVNTSLQVSAAKTSISIFYLFLPAPLRMKESQVSVFMSS